MTLVYWREGSANYASSALIPLLFLDGPKLQFLLKYGIVVFQVLICHELLSGADVEQLRFCLADSFQHPMSVWMGKSFYLV